MSVVSPLTLHLILLPSVGLAPAALKTAASVKHGKARGPCAQSFVLHTVTRSDFEDYIKRRNRAWHISGPSGLLVQVWHISEVVSGRL